MHEEGTARIRALNDELRVHGRGGQIVITRGVASLSEGDLARILFAVRRFDGFSGDNDPWGEHDCAVITVGDRRVIWKIDYYDETGTFGSPDPVDPAVTKRVLTIMLADEY